VTMRRSAQAMDRRDGRDGKDLASRREVDAGSIGVPHVIAVEHAATGAHVAVGVRLRDAKSGVVAVAGEIRLADLRNGVPMVVASIRQRLPRRLQRDGGERRRDVRRLGPRSTIRRAFDRCFR
jgi:hypothetical protein